MNMTETAKIVKRASVRLAAMSAGAKNAALLRIADGLEAREAEILRANELDLKQAKESGLDAPLLKRLRFDAGKLSDSVEGIRSLVKLPDPVGRTLLSTELDEGLELYRVSCPIGVIGIIFESRPDALVQISCLCLKSGNAVLLKGGSEALNTNRALAAAIESAAREAGLPEGWISLLTTREDVKEMLRLDDSIDLIIPRGSNEFVRYIMDNSRIPVLGHADGICHVYVDKDADPAAAVSIAVDSKTQYPAVCNAAETLLVHRDIAPVFLPAAAKALVEKGVTLYGCPETLRYIDARPAGPDSFDTEYLDYKMSVRVVEDLAAAIDHINTHGSGHTDAIVTENEEAVRLFLSLVDSGNVMHNCSTRFSDGYRYGFGAEVGISTNKIHARGPVGLEGLVIYKYLLLGCGQVVEDYAAKRRRFTHRPLQKDFPLS